MACSRCSSLTDLVLPGSLGLDSNRCTNGELISTLADAQPFEAGFAGVDSFDPCYLGVEF